MSDRFRDARKLRQRIYRLEVLLEIEKGERDHRWLAQKVAEDVERAEAVKRLLDTGLVETASPPPHFRLTPVGRNLFQRLR